MRVNASCNSQTVALSPDFRILGGHFTPFNYSRQQSDDREQVKREGDGD